MVSDEKLIEAIADCFDCNGKVRGVIGDASFHYLLGYLSMPESSPHQQQHASYPPVIEEQLRCCDTKGLPSLQNVPFEYFNDHCLSFSSIDEFLNVNPGRFVIVHLDRHSDLFKVNGQMHKGNYLWHVLAKHGERIHRCYWVIPDAIFTDGARRFCNILSEYKKDSASTPAKTIREVEKGMFTVNGVSTEIISLSNLPEITLPCIWDTDLDCTERYRKDRRLTLVDWLRFQNYGEVSDRFSDNIVVHPSLVGWTLRKKTKDCRQVLIAKERLYRMAPFYERVERDFLLPLTG